MKYLAVLLLTLSVNIQAQTYVVTTPQGYVANYVQIQGNQVTVTNPQGNIVQQGTVYSNQVVTPSGYAIGKPSFGVPLSPTIPPSPRVLQ